MSLHTAHPLDVDLVDFVDGSLHPATTRTIAAHLEVCLTCRIKRQRIAQTAPIPMTALGDVDIPAFGGVDVEPADTATAARGDVWLTASEDAVMVLVTKIRPYGRGVVVVPVVFDIEVADSGTLILDESASPLPVPVAIYDGLLTSLPTSALHGRVVPVRPDVDLLALTEADPGVSRGTPLNGPGDPRHEVRQDLIDRLVAVDTWPSDPAAEPPAAGDAVPAMPQFDDDTVQRRFDELRTALAARGDAAIEALPLQLPGVVRSPWAGIARIESFNQRIVLLFADGGLSDDRAEAEQVCDHFECSALGVYTDAGFGHLELYTRPRLAGERSVETGVLIDDPILAGPAVDTVGQYLDSMVSIPPVRERTAVRIAPLDPHEVLARQVQTAVAAQVAAGRGAHIVPKQEGLSSLVDIGPALTDLLHDVFSGGVAASSIVELADRPDP